MAEVSILIITNIVIITGIVREPDHQWDRGAYLLFLMRASASTDMLLGSKLRSFRLPQSAFLDEGR